MSRVIKIISFAYNRVPPKAACTLDCRSVANPYRSTALRSKSGLDPEVQEYVFADPIASIIMTRGLKAVEAGANDIAFGCYGGHHRSVAIAEKAADILRSRGLKVDVEHIALNAIAH